MGTETAAFLPEAFKPDTYLGLYVWLQLTFLVGLGSFAMMVVAITRSRLAVPVLLIGYSYLVFVATELLHFSNIILHNQLAPSSLDHYGLPLFLVIASAGLLGSIGMLLAVVDLAGRSIVNQSHHGSVSEYCADCPALKKATELGEFALRRRDMAVKKVAAK